MEEDTDINTPVDPQAFESVKYARNKYKKQNQEWIANFKRAHMKDPTRVDLEAIKESIDEYNFYNRKYVLLKAKMIRQGLIQPKFIQTEESQQPPSSMMRKVEMVSDPSLRKMKEDISVKEVQNQQLTDEIARLKYMLQDNVGENDVVNGLQKELGIKENQMKQRDTEINNLL